MKHNHAKRGAWSKTYRSWRYMRDRVARDSAYTHVFVCLRWEKFENFLADMGEQPDGKTLDRVNNLLPYSPENCRWATDIEQANNRTNNMQVAYNGETRTLAEWAKVLGINYKTLHNRVYSCGWDAIKALTTPHRGWNKNGLISNL